METIARARNEARTVGTSPFLFFLDDDVILDRRCALALLNGLGRYREAIVAAREASDDTPELFVSVWASIEALEAAVWAS